MCFERAQRIWCVKISANSSASVAMLMKTKRPFPTSELPSSSSSVFSGKSAFAETLHLPVFVR